MLGAHSRAEGPGMHGSLRGPDAGEVGLPPWPRPLGAPHRESSAPLPL